MVVVLAASDHRRVKTKDVRCDAVDEEDDVIRLMVMIMFRFGFRFYFWFGLMFFIWFSLNLDFFSTRIVQKESISVALVHTKRFTLTPMRYILALSHVVVFVPTSIPLLEKS